MPKQTKKSTETSVKKEKAKRASPKKTPETPEAENEEAKRGAKSQYANKVKPYLADIERYVHFGVTEGDLCRYYGVGKTQWAEYKKKYPEFSETLLHAREAQKEDLLDNAYRVAMGYYYEETHTVTVVVDGVPQRKTYTDRKYAKPDTGMIQFLLINRFSSEFARDPQMVALRKKALELAEQGKIPPDGWEGV